MYTVLYNMPWIHKARITGSDLLWISLNCVITKPTIVSLTVEDKRAVEGAVSAFNLLDMFEIFESLIIIGWIGWLTVTVTVHIIYFGNDVCNT